jgi:hypothetical protein
MSHPGKSQLIRVRFPHGGQALVAETNLSNAIQCGAVVIDPPKMEPTVNPAPEHQPRIFVLE